MTTSDPHAARSAGGDDRGLGQRLKDAVLGEPAPDERRRRDETRDDPRTGDAEAAWSGSGAAEPARDTGVLDDDRRADRAEGDTGRGGWGGRDDTRVGQHAAAGIGTTDPDTTADRAGTGDVPADRDRVTDRPADQGAALDRDAVGDQDRTADRDPGSERGVADQGAALHRDRRADRGAGADRAAQLDREVTSVGGDQGGGGGERERLVPSRRAQEYGARWDALKGDFVDEPRQAMAKADQLVDELLDEIQELFRRQRHELEQGLDRDQASTEDLRLALRRYRSFFDRLLSF